MHKYKWARWIEKYLYLVYLKHLQQMWKIKAFGTCNGIFIQDLSEN